MDDSLSSQNSSRHKNHQGQPKSLDAQLPRQPSGSNTGGRTHLLILNGGGHTAFLGDFFALVRFFEQRPSFNFGGEYWTTESPDECFARNKGVVDIKFGGHAVLNKSEIVCSKDGTSTRDTQNWVYLPPPDALARFDAWLRIKSDTNASERAMRGDSIILIFLAHGVQRTTSVPGSPDPVHTPVGLQLGHNILEAEKLVAQLRRFEKDIQINVISLSCYTGVFSSKIAADGQTDRWILAASTEREKAWPAVRSPSNRYRNSPFVAGLVRSLGGLSTLPISLGLKMVKDDVTKATQSHPDPSRLSTPQSYHSVHANYKWSTALPSWESLQRLIFQ